jgi:hypothetical protein
MAIELRNSLAGDLGLTLPAALLFEHPTIESLAAFLAKDLALESGGAVHDRAAAPENGEQTGIRDEAAAANVDGLSAEDMAALLAEEVGNLKQRQSP